MTRSIDGDGAARRERPHYPPHVPCNLRFCRVAGALLISFLLSSRAGAVTEPPPEPVRLGLYEWMGVSPIVIVGEVVADDGPLTRAFVKTAIRGGLAVGAEIEIDHRRADRDRDDGVRASDLSKGKTYLLLLQPSTRRRKDAHPLFDLVRGVRGAKALPVEGSAATIDAMTRLAEIQDRRNDDYLWTALPELLEDSNPVLVDAALDLYVKFRRENGAIASILESLLSHPRPDFRRRAATLIGRVLAHAGVGALPERPQIVATLTGRARTDDEATVRREATAALAALPDGGVDETLRAIARDDPDQYVRFEAEKSLSERSRGARKRSD